MDLNLVKEKHCFYQMNIKNTEVFVISVITRETLYFAHFVNTIL